MALLELMATDQGNRTTPCYVTFTHTDRLLGNAIKKQVTMNTQNTIFDAKRLLDRQFSNPSVQSDMMRWPFKVAP
ncbi:Heat shock protein 70 family [Parasponia andersonii]|uniref:Heat shock protein 70 family n=1 Tax=Parasponia andersonii TaxID=3476 RepID=A0A2P5B0V0_PARAD|nr:Heat shock protein 70 family [Parasponia andersonii]